MHVFRFKETKMLIASAVSLGIAGVLVFGSAPSPFQAGAQETKFDPPPVRQPESPPSIGPAGQTGPMNFGIPERVSNPGTPTSHGVFRLIPWGYGEALDHSDAPFPAGQAVEVIGTDAVEGSPLFEVPAYLPEGYQLAEVRGVRVGDEVVSVGLRFDGPSFPIFVVQRLVSRHPIDIYLSPSDAHSVIRSGEIAGQEAVFEELRPGSIFQVPLSVRSVESEKNTEHIVEWRVGDPSTANERLGELTKIAESVVR